MGKSSLPLWAGTVVAASLAGLLAGRNASLLVLAGAAAGAVALCLVGPRTRLVLSVAGALVVFQSELTLVKDAYLVLVVVCFLLSVRDLRAASPETVRDLTVLIWASIGLVAYLAFTAAVAARDGTSFGWWLRDALPYVLLAMLPFIGIAAGRVMTPRWNGVLVVVLGLVCSVGFAVDWLERRGVSSLPVGRVVLSSTVLVAFCLTFAMARMGTAARASALLWTAVACVIVCAVVVSGARSELVLLVGIVGMVGSARRMRIPVVRALAAVLAIAAAIVLAVPVVARSVIADPTFVQERVRDAFRIVDGRAGSDQSFAARARSYQWTLDTFTRHPFLGTGPGHLYPEPDTPAIKTVSLDTPLLVVAKFGVLGSAVLVVFLLALAVTVVRLARRYGCSPSLTAARGLLGVLVVSTPFGPWLEDKGLPFALALLLAGLVSDGGVGAAAADRNTAAPRRPPTAAPLEHAGASGR